MTGYQSKRAAAQDKLETWDTPSEAFNEWWDSDYDDSTNPYELDTFAYWAWAGWQAALAQPAQEPWPEEPFGHMAGGVQPPQRPWVGLTDEEAQWLYDNCRTPSNLIDMVEAKLKEKNNAA